MAFIVLLLAAVASVGAAGAAEDRVILKIDGKIAGSGDREFTRSQLESLGSGEIRTSTPWHEGVQTFEGVPLDTVMRAVGAQGSKVVVVALNQYRTEIPLTDFADYKVLLAMKRGGQYMEVRDKGPLFVIYPFDGNPNLKSERYYNRSAWQVRSITVE
ncbi:molybdopterin-dependent oxidoreductase [Hyphomicrobiaceae bacterium 22]|uniref:Molybdopterin-dependent oxidoreductase n=2 Tax=Prosthecodimorpha staleyi TaxID=2840188 RepID=A0A947GFN3_9HYPH|nr:molybdopterin-dependent oxidoreductase [Prosthecodimorpha staleyi]